MKMEENSDEIIEFFSYVDVNAENIIQMQIEENPENLVEQQPFENPDSIIQPESTTCKRSEPNQEQEALIEPTVILTEEDSLTSLLKSWKLYHLHDYFISQRITIEALKLMEHHHIEALFRCQAVGDLVIFEYHLKEWRQKFSLLKNGVSSVLPSIRKISASISNIHSPSSTAPSSPEPYECIVALSDILNSNQKGSILMAYYDEHSKLKDEHRQVLINIICKYFEDHDIHMSLLKSYNLEEEILNRFPGEREEYYRTGKRGRIYNKFCNTKRANQRLKRSSSSEILKGSLEVLMESPKIFCPESDAEEYIRSLRFDHLSVSEFDSCWQACSHFRLQYIMNTAPSLADVFKQWPEYKKPSGYRFIDKDFGVAFPNHSGILNDWPENFQQILAFLTIDGHIKDKQVKAILSELSTEDINNDAAAVKLLWSMHAYLIPTQKIAQMDNNGKKSFIKYTVKSSQEAFLFVGSSVQELDDHIKFLNAKPGGSIQPFLLAVGDKDSMCCQSFYVYLEGVKFCFHNFLRALDICFKSYHLFNLEYPPPCIQFWNFVAKHFYKFENKVATSTRLSIMLEALKT